MKRLPTAILAAASAAALVGLLLAPKGHPASSQEAHPGRTGRAVDRRQESEAAPDDWMVSQRVNGAGVPRGAAPAAARQSGRLAAATAALNPRLAASQWQFAGPTNIGGRVLDVVPDPASTNTVYTAAASGGVWKSTDGGSTFVQDWPISNPQAIGALAMGSDGTLWAGTGEAGPGGGSITYGGRGVYRSPDGGATWTNAGLTSTVTTGRIAVDPSDPQRIFVASSGDLFNPGGGRGVYRSTDGGATWQRVLSPSTRTTGAVDLAIDPSNPQRIYAALWDHIRYPDLRVYGGVGSGVYRSTDGGTTWTRLANGLPGPSSTIGRIGLAVAPSNTLRVYAIVIATDGTFQGLYRSNDGGDSWTHLPDDPGLAGSQSSYGWWFGRLWVDPVNANHVFAAGVSLEESTNGGSNWSAQFGIHGDVHAMAWSPAQSGLVFLGDDGGVWRSTTNGSSWTHATVEPFTQFYSVGVSEQDNTRIVGGSQDNNALRSWPGTWNAFVGGDGEETLIDPANQNNVYGCSQYGFCERSTDGGNTMLGFGGTVSDRYNWFTPVQFGQAATSTVYLGGNKLNRSTNKAQTFSVISPDLTGGPGRDPNYPYGTITTISAGTSALFVGTDDSRVWTSTNGGSTWTRVDDPALPAFWVSRVAVDPSNNSRAYVTLSGYRNGSNGAYVFKTHRWRHDVDRHHGQPPEGAGERHRDRRRGRRHALRGHRRGRLPEHRRRRDLARGGHRSAPRSGRRHPTDHGDEHPVRGDLRPRDVEGEAPGLAPASRVQRQQRGFGEAFGQMLCHLVVGQGRLGELDQHPVRVRGVDERLLPSGVLQAHQRQGHLRLPEACHLAFDVPHLERDVVHAFAPPLQELRHERPLGDGGDELHLAAPGEAVLDEPEALFHVVGAHEELGAQDVPKQLHRRFGVPDGDGHVVQRRAPNQGQALGEPVGHAPAWSASRSASRRSACSTSSPLPMAAASSRAWASRSRACWARVSARSGVAYFSFSSALMIISKISLGSIGPPGRRSLLAGA